MIYSSAVPVTSARSNDKRRRDQLRVDVALSQDDIQETQSGSVSWAGLGWAGLPGREVKGEVQSS